MFASWFPGTSVTLHFSLIFLKNNGTSSHSLLAIFLMLDFTSPKKIREKCDVILVPGNHDANIEKLVPDNISMISSTGMVDENILLTHGHTMPSENFSHVDKIIMAHIHPVFFQEDSVINGQRVWISMKTEKENIFPNKSGELEIIVIPSFNKYFYATHRKQYKKSISPIINKIKSISSARIITLDGVIIGDESIIDQVI